MEQEKKKKTGHCIVTYRVRLYDRHYSSLQLTKELYTKVVAHFFEVLTKEKELLEQLGEVIEINEEKVEIKNWNQLLNITLNSKQQDMPLKMITRGIFLGAGALNNPEKTYHLDIGIVIEENAIKLTEKLDENGISLKIIYKKNAYHIYTKDGEEISKFLAFIGANKAVLEFENIRVEREMRNKINRMVNCESANLNKTMNASIEQIEAINKLQKSRKLNKLDDELKEIAEIRLKNPNASLVEIGKMLKNPVGKSGVNYRLKKIVELAENI